MITFVALSAFFFTVDVATDSDFANTTIAGTLIPDASVSFGIQSITCVASLAMSAVGTSTLFSGGSGTVWTFALFQTTFGTEW